MKIRVIIAIILTIILPTASWGLPVTVTFSLVEPFTGIDQTFSVSIIADIPKPVVGWGIDIDYDSDLLDLRSTVVADIWMPQINDTAISPLLMAAPATFNQSVGDGDGLYALVFPNGIFGEAVPLATLNFTVKGIGSSPLIASYTTDDKNEGFLYADALCGMADIEFNNVFLEISPHVDNTFALSTKPVPEPSTLLLLGIGLIGAGIMRPKKNFKM